MMPLVVENRNVLWLNCAKTKYQNKSGKKFYDEFYFETADLHLFHCLAINQAIKNQVALTGLINIYHEIY